VLNTLPSTPVVFAVSQNKSPVSGDLNASTGQVTFPAVLRPKDKLFFLDPVTLVPLTTPAELSAA